MLMEQSVITGALAISVALLNPSSVNHIDNSSHQVVQQEMRDYRVQNGDNINSIAQNLYGSSDFWTTIWKDNSWIQNPDVIEEGWIIKIRNVKPAKHETIENETIEKVEIILNPTLTPSITPTNNQTSPTPTIPQVTQVTSQTSSSGPLNEAQINFLGNCEAGMNPTRNSGNGYYGAFQFSYGTWKSMGTAYERADLAPIEVQIDAVQRLVARSSIFHQFPGCARRMQAEGLLQNE